MFKRIGAGFVFVLFVLALVSMASAQQAQQALKISVVDSQKAFDGSIEGKKEAAQFQTRKSKFESDMARMDSEIQQLESKLNTQRLTLTQEALLQIQAELQKKLTARKRYEEDATQALKQFQFTLLKKIQTEMVAIVDAIAKEKGIDLVLDLGASGVVYFDTAIDITDEVIKRYDASKSAAPKK